MPDEYEASGAVSAQIPTRDVEDNVALLREWLREAVGRDWQHATRDHADRRGSSVTHDSSVRPWIVQRAAMRTARRTAYWTTVQSYVERLAPWQVWTA